VADSESSTCPSREYLIVTDDRAAAVHDFEVKEEKKSFILSMGSRRGHGSVAPSLPPTLQLTPSVNQTFRFSVTSTGVYPVTVGNLLAVCGNVASTVLLVKSVCASLKLNRVTMWPGTVTGGASVAQLWWNSGESGQVPDEFRDGSIPSGVTVTKALTFEPPAKSLASYWIGVVDSAAVVFTLEADAGAIVDVHITGRLCNVFSSFGTAVASATLGTFYYLSLDGPASNKIVPIGLPTTH